MESDPFQAPKPQTLTNTLNQIVIERTRDILQVAIKDLEELQCYVKKNPIDEQTVYEALGNAVNLLRKAGRENEKGRDS